MCLTPAAPPGSSNTFTNDFRTMLARRYQASLPHEASTALPGTLAADMAAKNDAQSPLPPSVASFPILGASSSSSSSSSSPPNGDSSDYATDDDAPRPCLSTSRQHDIRVLHRNAKQAVGLRRAQWLRRRGAMSSSSCNNSSAENSSTVILFSTESNNASAGGDDINGAASPAGNNDEEPQSDYGYDVRGTMAGDYFGFIKQPAAVDDDAAAAAAFTRRRLLLEEFCLAGTTCTPYN